MFDRFCQEITKLKNKNLLRQLMSVEGEQGTTLSIHGKTVISLSSNNYLGLANHPALKTISIQAIQTYGVGAGASRLISGNSTLYDQLEEKLSSFKQVPSCLVFNSGYMANLSLIPALTLNNGVILADELNHASLFEGCRLSPSMLRVYRHRDMSHLEKLLQKYSSVKPTLIVTDGVFSMDGDLAPLPSIFNLAQKFNSKIYVDDAHGTGVLGKHGRGTVEHFNLEGKIEIQMATLGKALGTYGAFIACNPDIRTFLLQKAKPLIYTTALPPFILAASIESIAWIQKHPELREKLWKNREYFMSGLKSLGFNLTKSETPIIPVLIGETDLALTFSQHLLNKGIFAPAIRPPTVPKETSRIRTTIMATHTLEQLDYVLDSFHSIGKTLGILR